MKFFSPTLFQSVWSATPTPLDAQGHIDVDSVEHLVEHHLRLGVRGLFVAGTCGEGPWMPDRERRCLVQTVVKASAERLPIAVQVSDNSAARILDNIEIAAEDGADFAVIAPPRFLFNATPQNVLKLYQTAIRGSKLPVIIYDLGANAPVLVAEETLSEIYAEPNVVAIKDSSSNDARRDLALEARKKRPDMRLLTGNEFKCAEYLEAGYDGLMLGGAAFSGFLAGKILEAAKIGDFGEAHALQTHMNRLLWDVYGGEKITCWLGGEKQMMVELGVFSTNTNFLGYEVTPECGAAISRVVKEDAAILLP